jgi:hypothetical protein
MIGTYLTMGLTMMEDMKTQSEQRKKEILAEWNKSKNYPRKKKKRVRKELQLDWAIANWDPFDGMVNF